MYSRGQVVTTIEKRVSPFCLQAEEHSYQMIGRKYGRRTFL